MREYYGMFKEIKSMYGSDIEDIDIYSGAFSNVYTELVGKMSKDEFDFYVNSVIDFGKDILEVACGDGKRVMSKLAKLGFKVDGVEISKDMINAYNIYSKSLPYKVKNNIKIYESDIFNFYTDKKYDVITIPATTICLLSDDEDKLIDLFNKFYNMLNPQGKLVFDYRLNIDYQKTETPLNYWIKKNASAKILVIFQEFHNYIKGRTIANFYMEQDTKDGTKRYLTLSNKKIINQSLIDDILSKTKFKVHKILDIDLLNDEKLRMISLRK